MQKTVSTKIKLLILLWQTSSEESCQRVNCATRSNQIGIKRDDSIVALPKQVQYAKLFNILQQILLVSTVSTICMLSSMTEDIETRKAIDANLQRLMNRVDFRGGFEGKNVNQAKDQSLRTLENTRWQSKKPAFFRQFVE